MLNEFFKELFQSQDGILKCLSKEEMKMLEKNLNK